MELPLVSIMLNLVLRCLTEPHPKCEADGILPIFLFRDGLLVLIYSFFDGSNEVLVLSSQYTEIFNGDSMTRDVRVVIYWERGL